MKNGSDVSWTFFLKSVNSSTITILTHGDTIMFTPDGYHDIQICRNDQWTLPEPYQVSVYLFIEKMWLMIKNDERLCGNPRTDKKQQFCFQENVPPHPTLMYINVCISKNIWDIIIIFGLCIDNYPMIIPIKFHADIYNIHWIALPFSVYCR